MSPSKDKKVYSIHFNGGVPFIVHVTARRVSVYENVADDEEENKEGELITKTAYTAIFIGDNDLNDADYEDKGLYPGNSILVHIAERTYLYIGSEIYTFKTAIDDQIVSYFSPIGNCDVPYPYALGTRKVYFMLDKRMVPMKGIDPVADGYRQFYDWFQYLNMPSMHCVTVIRKED